jgi:MFS family permease
VLLGAVSLVDAIDRGVLPGVLTTVQDDLGFGDTAAGFLGPAFIIAGVLATLPAGILADRYSRTRIISLALVSWSVLLTINSAVRNYPQFLAVRATLGIGETVDNPASSSLIADYYRPDVRSRAYAFIRVAPIAGLALGIIIGGQVADRLGWRWAFLIVGAAALMLAVAMWRAPEPERGESDTIEADDVDLLEPPATRRDGGVAAVVRDVRDALAVRSLRALMIGSAISVGALGGIGFWAPAFYERHAGMDPDESAVLAGGLILVGSVVGVLIGGKLADRLRVRDAGAPMMVAGGAQALGALLIFPTFLPTPLWFRMPVQVLAVACILGGLPGLSTMISEVVPATMRGISFSMTTFLGGLVGAASPPLVGFLADRFAVTVDGATQGHLANAFLCVTPLVFLGGLVGLRGRRVVGPEVAAALADRQAAETGESADQAASRRT